MEDCGNFIQWLGPDMSMKILDCLEDPSDFVRVGAVSSSWRQYVIENGFCKRLCLEMFPEVSGVTDAIEDKNTIDTVEVELDKSVELTRLERDHRVYAFLSRGLSPFLKKDCILEAICASSTDNYPEESIRNTLVPNDRVGRRASYWSSKGASDPAVPETLMYELAAKFCVITEIHVQPFQAYFQFGFPIYSAKAVRFRLGHPKQPMELERNRTDEFGDVKEPFSGKFVWTYTSPEFPMAQDKKLQKFKLPKAVLCVGGILQLELLGRVQRQEMDGLFYICVAHVQVVGRPLLPAFDAEILDQSGKCILKYYPEEKHPGSPSKSGKEHSTRQSCFHRFTLHIRRSWDQAILNTVISAGAAFEDNDEAA
ncbi:F-box protein At4g00755-like [Ipomoea triloba]|uniref:F-box protein At4g00755-like n=1 Tax=Ipomoea triloba TaxID=35885 RepID=UPI00125E0C49|nr:F-box protein At4g00755-like [Ipomoea triloba]